MSLKKLTRSTQACNRTASHTCLLFWALFLFFLRWRGQGWWLQCIFSRCCCCQPNIAVMRQSEGSKKNKIPLLISNSWMPLAGIRTRLRLSAPHVLCDVLYIQKHNYSERWEYRKYRTADRQM